MYTGLYLQLFIKEPDTKEPEQRTTLRIFSFMLIRMLKEILGTFVSGIKGRKQLRIICNSVTIPCCLVHVRQLDSQGHRIKRESISPSFKMCACSGLDQSASFGEVLEA